MMEVSVRFLIGNTTDDRSRVSVNIIYIYMFHHQLSLENDRLSVENVDSKIKLINQLNK